MEKSLLVHVVQTTSIDDTNANWEQISGLLNALPVAKAGGLTLVSLPENALFMRIQEGQKIEPLNFQHPVWERIQKMAREKNWIFHFGSVPIKARGQGAMGNNSVTVWPDGRHEVTYQKIHLFDIQLEGQKPTRESDVFEHGGRPEILPIGSWKFGQSICYDLRFSDLYHQYALQGADVLLVPSSFLVTTGQAHWEILLRARAIESQAYVIAAAQAGTHRSPHTRDERKTFGHSLVIDPWGKILAMASPDQPQVLSVTLSRGEIERVRRQIPMAGHRRLHRR